MPTHAPAPPPVTRRMPGRGWRAALAGSRQRRALAFGGLALLVVLLHAAFLRSPAGALGRPLLRPEQGAQPMRMVLAAAPAARPAATALAPATLPATPPAQATRAPVPRSARPARATPPAVPAATAPLTATAAEPHRDATQPAVPRQGPVAMPADQPMQPAQLPAASIAQPPAPVALAPDAAPLAAAPPSSAPDEPALQAGSTPPVYPTEVPGDRTLDFRVVRGGATGTGQLRWQATPAAYTLSLQANAPGGPALDWLSTGGFDSAGLAPQRMVERQRQRDTHAVNFQRDKHLISFSGPSREEPLLHGAQDRLSWLIQLSAVAQAQRETLKQGDTLRFQVASPRGDVDEWLFTVGSTVVLDLAGTRWVALKLVREPRRPYDQRVEVWLAPTASHLPLGLTLTTVPGGVPLELWLAGGLRLEL